MKRCGILVLLLILRLCVLAQDAVTGVITDSLGQCIMGAAVVVMDASDTTSIAWEYSQEDGKYVRQGR